MNTNTIVMQLIKLTISEKILWQDIENIISDLEKSKLIEKSNAFQLYFKYNNIKQYNENYISFSNNKIMIFALNDNEALLIIDDRSKPFIKKMNINILILRLLNAINYTFKESTEENLSTFSNDVVVYGI